MSCKSGLIGILSVLLSESDITRQKVWQNSGKYEKNPLDKSNKRFSTTKIFFLMALFFVPLATPAADPVCNKESLVADPTNATIFYHCQSDGAGGFISHKKSCSNRLYFCPEMEVCMYAGTSGCSFTNMDICGDASCVPTEWIEHSEYVLTRNQMDLDNYYCNCVTGNAEYTCKDGYYGNATSSGTGCTACPLYNGNQAHSRVGSNTTITSCFVPTNINITDTNGTYKFIDSCYYTN